MTTIIFILFFVFANSQIEKTRVEKKRLLGKLDVELYTINKIKTTSHIEYQVLPNIASKEEVIRKQVVGLLKFEVGETQNCGTFYEGEIETFDPTHFFVLTENGFSFLIPRHDISTKFECQMDKLFLLN